MRQENVHYNSRENHTFFLLTAMNEILLGSVVMDIERRPENCMNSNIAFRIETVLETRCKTQLQDPVYDLRIDELITSTLGNADLANTTQCEQIFQALIERFRNEWEKANHWAVEAEELLRELKIQITNRKLDSGAAPEGRHNLELNRALDEKRQIEEKLKNHERTIEVMKESYQARIRKLESDFARFEEQDKTIAMLEEQIIQMDETIDQSIEERVRSKELELQRSFESAKEAYQEKIAAQQAQILSLETQLDSARIASKKAAESLQMTRIQYETDLTKHQDTIAILQEQLHSQQQKQQPLHRGDPSFSAGNDPLGVGTSVSKSPCRCTELDVLVRSLESELRSEQQKSRTVEHRLNGQLDAATLVHAEQLQALEGAREAAIRMEKRLAELEREIDTNKARATKEREELRERLEEAQTALAGRPTCEEVVRLQEQLEILRRLEVREVAFDGEDEDSGVGRPPVLPKPSASTQEKFDVAKVLLRQVRAHERRYLSLQKEHLQLQCQKDTLLQEQESLQAEVASLRQREAELSRMGLPPLHMDTPHYTPSPAAAVPTPIAAPPLSTPQKSFSMESQLRELVGTLAFTPANASSHQAFVPPVTPFAGASGPAGTSVDPVLTALRTQCHRLRGRVEVLETELTRVQASLSSLEAQNTQLSEDNVNLYQKNKYLQVCLQDRIQGRNPTPLPTQSAQAPVTTFLNSPAAHTPLTHRSAYLVAGDDAFEERYRDRYRERLDPFREFVLQQQQEEYQKLSKPEKAVFKGTQWVLGTEKSRKIAFYYVALLHIVFIGTLWHFGIVGHDHCSHVSH